MHVCFSTVRRRAQAAAWELRGRHSYIRCQRQSIREREYMTTLRRTVSRLAAALAAVALLACAKPDESSRSADSTARNLTLAPTESTAALMLAAGTRVAATAVDSISTRTAKAGDPFTATVSQDVKDATGRVVIPAGATVSGTIAAAEPAPNPNSTGRIDLSVTSVTVHGRSYAIDASVVAMDTIMKGRGVTKADAAKVAGGAAAGAIIGKLLGKNTKGDVVIPKGAGITVKLNAPLTVKTA